MIGPGRVVHYTQRLEHTFGPQKLGHDADWSKSAHFKLGWSLASSLPRAKLSVFVSNYVISFWPLSKEKVFRNAVAIFEHHFLSDICGRNH